LPPEQLPKGKHAHVRQYEERQELKKPSSLDVKTGADSKRKATFVAEPSSAATA